jgi:hypothetical protein
LSPAQTHPHSPHGALSPRRCGIEVDDPRALVTDDDLERLRGSGIPNPEFGAAAAGIFESIARKLGNSGGDARLVLSIEAQEFGKAACPFADEYDGGLALERNNEKPRVHDAARIATTAASSRPRR